MQSFSTSHLSKMCRDSVRIVQGLVSSTLYTTELKCISFTELKGISSPQVFFALYVSHFIPQYTIPIKSWNWAENILENWMIVTSPFKCLPWNVLPPSVLNVINHRRFFPLTQWTLNLVDVVGKKMCSVDYFICVILVLNWNR